MLLVDLLLRVAINGIAFILAIEFVPKVHAPNDLVKLIILAAIFGVVNAYIRPIARTLSMPLNLLSFGLIGLIINVSMVFIAAFISSGLSLNLRLAGWPPGPFQIDSIVGAVLISLVVSIVAAVVALIRKLTPGI